MKVDSEKDLCKSIIPLKNRGAIRLTISKYYLPSGKSISEVGVSPDIVVTESSEEFRINTKSDNQLDYVVKLQWMIIEQSLKSSIKKWVGIILLTIEIKSL